MVITKAETVVIITRAAEITLAAAEILAQLAGAAVIM